MFFPFERAAEVLHAWTELAPTLPDEMMSWASLLQFPDAPFVPETVRGGSFAVVYGAFLGSEPKGRSLLRPVRELGPAMDTFAMVAARGAGRHGDGPAGPPPLRDQHGATERSAPGRRRRPRGRCRTGVGIQPRNGGAAATRRRLRAADPRSRSAGDAAGHAQPDRARGARERGDRGIARAYLESLDQAVRPYHVGDYANFVMEPTDASRFFDADTWARLRQVKALYDADDLFKGNHHIPPA